MRRERRGERERGVKMEMGSKPELRMDLGAVYVPNDVSGFLREVAKVGEISEKLSKLEDYVRRLEDELRKVDAFRRELPLCMLLLNDAIVRVKEEAMQCRESEDRSVMEEFMPLKANSDEDEDGGLKVAEDCKDKKHWMSSAQLWNSKHSILQLKLKQECEEDNETPYQQCDYRNKGGAIVPFRGNSGFPATALTDGREREVPDLSLMTPGIKTPISEVGSLNLSSNSCSRSGLSGSSSATEQTKTQQQNTFRKHRRCWSPELHRRFVDALQRLGGWQAATPKQIRELMQVDGLTNDEVKSHLQKYRLHVRRLPASSTAPVKGKVSQSDSPEGPLHLYGSAKGVSITGEEEEEEEEEKSKSHSWKDRLHKPKLIR
ncbi:transcription factor HHO5-like isoform X1 [Malania oleifera]|uniref:transcription factor HHO5-like isoform X1 n=1 Tax=Malania oleifera TaxID=397392 RepID=UPI0025AE2F4B|nr:transcription factor HHO5-like isoform X1 [Malania oleifera]